MPIAATYSIPPQTFSMNAGIQQLAGVVCVACPELTIGSVDGQFLGTNRQSFAASILVRNSQLITNGFPTTNAGGNVSVYERQQPQ